jgi:hypothetical protein
MFSESLAGSFRNHWPNVPGISGRMFSELVAEWGRNSQLTMKSTALGIDLP